MTPRGGCRGRLGARPRQNPQKGETRRSFFYLFCHGAEARIEKTRRVRLWKKALLAKKEKKEKRIKNQSVLFKKKETLNARQDARGAYGRT